MKKIGSLIVELICTIIIYQILITIANKVGLFDATSNLIYTTVGFAIGWLIVKLVIIIKETKNKS